jgi:hypothetical protein
VRSAVVRAEQDGSRLRFLPVRSVDGAPCDAEGLSGAEVDCFEEALTEDLVRDFMLAVFAEGDESDEAEAAVRAIEEAAAPCENVR